MRAWAGTPEGVRITGVELPPRPKSTSGIGGRVTGASKFEQAVFEARLNKAEFISTGEMRVILLIPDTYADEAATLRDAFSCALLVRVEKTSHVQ